VSTNPDRDESQADPTIVDDATGELLVPLITTDTGPARAWAEAAHRDAVAPPHAVDDDETHLTVRRTFCFVDLSGFTPYTREYGPHAAVRVLSEFRRVTRNVAARRGVRIAKWLGDGAMLVGTEPKPTVALGAHLVHHFANRSTTVRVGIASGVALLYEGDDYIGEPVNLAAKLCAAAAPGEILTVVTEDDLPDWVKVRQTVSVDIRGIGTIGGVSKVEPVTDRS